jgi:hypothetical protein
VNGGIAWAPGLDLVDGPTMLVPMTEDHVAPPVAKPDYSRVRGWLLAFGVYAGWAFLSGAFSDLMYSGAQHAVAHWLPPTAAKFYLGGLYFGYVMLLLFLVQCVCIFRRLRFARQLSLVIFAAKFLMVAASVPFLAAVVDATVVENAPREIDLEAYARALKTTLTLLAYIGAFLGLVISIGGFLYFWRSERVKQTLVH